jgi:hypothetical protein
MGEKNVDNLVLKQYLEPTKKKAESTSRDHGVLSGI